MKSLEDAKQNTLRLFSDADWVKWVHEGSSPAYTSETKTINIVLSALSLGMHCPTCLNLNGCCFPRNNMTKHPLHENCHCTVEPVNSINFVAECDIGKFEKYIFNTDIKINKGKKALFESWGYNTDDSKWLQQELTRQAVEKYQNGDFTLNKLDIYGQRINIEITLPRKNNDGFVVFITGWMVYPDGMIQLTTPYGD